MGFDADHQAADIEALFDAAAVAAKYDAFVYEDDAKLEPVDLYSGALFGRSFANDQAGDVVADRLVAWVRASDFSTPPEKRHTIIRGSEVWEITGVELVGNLGRLTLERNARPVPR